MSHEMFYKRMRKVAKGPVENSIPLVRLMRVAPGDSSDKITQKKNLLQKSIDVLINSPELIETFMSSHPIEKQENMIYELIVVGLSHLDTNGGYLAVQKRSENGEFDTTKQIFRIANDWLLNRFRNGEQIDYDQNPIANAVVDSFPQDATPQYLDQVLALGFPDPYKYNSITEHNRDIHFFDSSLVVAAIERGDQNNKVLEKIMKGSFWGSGAIDKGIGIKFIPNLINKIHKERELGLSDKLISNLSKNFDMLLEFSILRGAYIDVNLLTQWSELDTLVGLINDERIKADVRAVWKDKIIEFLQSSIPTEKLLRKYHMGKVKQSRRYTTSLFEEIKGLYDMQSESVKIPNILKLEQEMPSSVE